MKKSIMFLSALLISALLYGQAYEGAVKYQKEIHPSAIIELPYNTSIVNAAMNDYLSKKGKAKQNEMKGFNIFRNTHLVSADSTNADLYFKTERKSRKEKNITVVTLLVRQDTGSIYGSNLHYMNMEDSKKYLNDLAENIGAYNLELTIKDQNEAVAKAEAKYRNLTIEAKDLDKKRMDLENKITENKEALKAQIKEIENEKQKLEQRVGQRKS